MNSTGRKKFSFFAIAACGASRRQSFCVRQDFRKSPTWPAASTRGPKRSILMCRAIKVPPRAPARNRHRARALMVFRIRSRARAGGEALVLLLLISLGVLTGCDRMITQRQTQVSKDADAKAAEGNYAEAINLYEAALDGRTDSADVHYKLALIYDDKLNDPLNALHHFRRLLTLVPSGKRAEEVKGFMKRDELTLLTNLSGDSVVTRAEAVRLRNENLNLRQQIEERWAQNKAASAAEKASTRPKSI